MERQKPHFGKMNKSLLTRLVYVTRNIARSASGVSEQWSYAHTVGKKPLLGTTIGKRLEEAVTKTPGDMAAIFADSGAERTFEQLYNNAMRLAGGLLSLGVTRGDRVGVFGPNSVEWLETQYATALIGAILVNVNPASRGNELLHIVRSTDCQVLLIAPTTRYDHHAVLCEAAPELRADAGSDAGGVGAPPKLRSMPSLRHVVMMGSVKKPHSITYDDLLAAATTKRIDEVKQLRDVAQFDDVANIQFTSGTTGTPKGAALTHFNLINNAYVMGLRLGFGIGTRICVAVPFFHAFGCSVGNLQIAAHNATLISPSQYWNASDTMTAIERYSCDVMYGTPTMYIDMMGHRERSKFKLESLRRAVTGAAPCTPAFLRKVKRNLKLQSLIVAYGTTELSPLISNTLQNDSEDIQVTSVGSVIEYCEVKIVDKNNRVVKLGENGEVLIRGPFTMLNYWAQPEKTREVLDSDRWYRTGDVGKLVADPQKDDSRYLVITSRIKDMIDRGGEKIYPVEVEQLIAQHEAVADVHVVGVPDERLGERVCACVKVKVGFETVKAADIIAFCKSKLADFKVPSYVLFINEYPLTASGKVPKYILRQVATKELKLDHISPDLKY